MLTCNVVQYISVLNRLVYCVYAFSFVCLMSYKQFPPPYLLIVVLNGG
jgi:hypothetical protein